MDGSEHCSGAESGAAATPNSKIARSSCDLCKRMKIKCDWQGDSCKHCAARSVECTVTTQVRKQRIIKRTDYLAALEDRINQMEAAINASGLAAQRNERGSIVDTIGDQAMLSDRMSTLVVNEEGVSEFIGPSSGFSLFSPRGLQWIKEKIGAHETERLVKTIGAGNKNWGDFSTIIWRSRPDDEQEPLPSKDVADRYVDGYFRNFNPVFPVFHETSFRILYERQYSDNPPTSVAWYASFNGVLAIGSSILKDRLNNAIVNSLVDIDSISHDVCWAYFRNASSKFTDLIFKAGEIMAIQAILCMALMCQAISDPQPSYMLAATAVRLSHAIGLHRNLGDFGLSAVQMKERQNVFWITYMLDVGISLKTGRPPAMSDQNIAVAIPRMKSEGFDNFRCLATIALLESHIYSELYSAKAGTRSALDRLKSIGRLDAELTQWRDDIPEECRPESEIICSKHQFIPVIMMHFAYYNCLTAIHRASIHHGSWTSEPNDEAGPEDHHDEKLNPRVYVSSSLCLGAARNVIGLLKHFNRDVSIDGLIWMATYYPLSAALALFANVIQNPQSLEAFSDIELIGVVTEFLSQSVEFSKYLEGTLRIFAEVKRIAGSLVRDTQMTTLRNLKRRHEETADFDSQNDPSTSSKKPSINPFGSPDASYDLNQSMSYPYYESLPFSQPQDFYLANDTFPLQPNFQFDSANMWTEPAAEDFLPDGYIWYI